MNPPVGGGMRNLRLNQDQNRENSNTIYFTQHFKKDFAKPFFNLIRLNQKKLPLYNHSTVSLRNKKNDR